jgi:hypothetical protein
MLGIVQGAFRRVNAQLINGVAAMNKDKAIKIRFPLWQYLKQPLFDRTTVISPFKFWHNYQVRLLECCWNLNSIKLLEMCWNCESK